MLRLIVGIGLVAITWGVIRREAGARLRGGPWAALPLDALPPFLGFALFLLPTGRPIMAAIGIAALGFGLAVADRMKRKILDEPVLFADRAELLEVVRHPRLYLAFIGTGAAIAIAALIAAAIAGMFWAEPPLWPVSVGGFLIRAGIALVLGRACFVLPGYGARPLARLYARLAPTRDPEVDGPRLGLLATLIVHATIARAERAGRQAAAQARSFPALPSRRGPIVIVQGESFVDASRLDPGLAGVLPHFAALCADAAAHGRLAVPCWGANTIRTELAVLTGLDEAALGLDRFNPYEHFAQTPLPSLAHAARAAGYRTIFVHPYSRTFYARHKVLPRLGFDRFIGIEAFADAPRVAGYVGDEALGSFVADLVVREGPDVLVFVVTMENHGPWDDTHDPAPPDPLPPSLAGLADADAIGRWLRHLRATDAMIPSLRAAIERHGHGWLAFYGDHQPSLTGLFRSGVTDRRTDYAIWSPGSDPGKAHDLAADALPGHLLALIARAADAA